jgi:helicase-like protein/SNF2 domain-containing protein
MNYHDFLEQKKRVFLGTGITVNTVPAQLYPFQQALVKWALRKGRAAIFADCGLGKTFMQVAWADALHVPTLILAPLCVAEQTVGEAAKLGIAVRYARDQSDVDGHRIVITNYERLDKFNPSTFQAVVLDESSILKAFDGKTRTALIEAFAATPYRLCCTATPSPNDIAELANHAEFLGLMTRAEFLATWFVHDDAGWRMKRHAVQPFYRWLASWAIAMRTPSDLGYSDDGFQLPPLRIYEHIVESDGPSASLFPELGLKGIGGRLTARRGSIDARISKVCNLVPEYGQSWILWCGLNDEADHLTAELPGCVNIQGSDTYAEKRGAVEAFISGQVKIIASKLRVVGYGMNFQHCHHMAFVGIGDSFEQYYQGIRRCWRFGQTYPVEAHIVVSDAERAVVQNVKQKETVYREMVDAMLSHVRDFEREELCA